MKPAVWSGRLRRLPLYLRSFLSHARSNGMAAAVVKSYQYVRWGFGHGYGAVYRRWFVRSGVGDDVAPASVLFERPSVLIVGPLDLPQCRKYRVVQKLELLHALGVEGHMSHQDDQVRVYNLMQTATHLLFYRVAASAVVDGYIQEARRLGLALAYDIDDPIFDAATYRGNRNLETLDRIEREQLLASAGRHLEVMRQCPQQFVSTGGMAARVRAVLGAEAAIWPNAVDAETAQLAAQIREQPPAAREETVIGYMSGSRAHDRDFESIAPVLAELLGDHQELVLMLVGYVDVPDCLKAYADRLRQIPFGNYHEYFAVLAQAHLVVVPLLIDGFNECKSAIRYFEAALLGIPVVASRVGQFREVIADGRNGFLAADADDWSRSIGALLDDAALRNRVGQAARESVLAEHTVSAVAPRVQPALERYGLVEQPANKRLLVLNVHYAPHSFGGATIVAEALNESLTRDYGWQVTVITTHVDPAIPAYHLRRYRAGSVDVISINLPTEKRYDDEYENRYIDAVIERLLPRLAPDVVHAHALQRLGCGYFESIKAKGIPLVVTVHDAWWLCDRQFMVDLNGRYCFQREISADRCRYCVDLPDKFEQKLAVMKRGLQLADLVLAPSRFQADLYAANGFENCRVNGNGIVPPGEPATRARARGDRLVFGFIGGPGPLKGAPVIVSALNQLQEYRNYVLKVVDAAQNVGVSWNDPGFWQVPGEVVFEPAYSQSGIDDFFAGIDVLLFPSQWKESFGLTVREALARDVWVIACSEGGVGEAICDGENGELIPMTADPEPLRLAIARCLAQPDRIRAHRNPRKESIRLFPEQARELDGWLDALVAAR